MANNRQRFPFRPMEVPPKKSETSELCSPRLVVDTWLFRSPLPLRPMNAAQGIPGANKRRPPLLLSSQISIFWGDCRRVQIIKAGKKPLAVPPTARKMLHAFFIFLFIFAFFFSGCSQCQFLLNLLHFQGKLFFFLPRNFCATPALNFLTFCF